MLRVIGCSPAWPNPGEACSGYLADLPGGRLLLDCGHGVVSRLRALELWPDAIVLSHLHADHAGDLLPLMFAIQHGGLPAPQAVFVPPGARVLLAEQLAGQGLRVADMERAFPIREYRTAVPLELLGARISSCRTKHAPHACALRIEDGRAVVYTGDSPPNPDVAQLARGADLLLSEATLLEVTEDPAPGRCHMTATEAGALARASAVGRLVITHLPAERRPEAHARAAAEFTDTVVAVPDLVA